MSYGLKETQSSLISHYTKKKREASKFYKKFKIISLSNINISVVACVEIFYNKLVKNIF